MLDPKGKENVENSPDCHRSDGRAYGVLAKQQGEVIDSMAKIERHVIR
jgi:hypothetical protein